MPALIRRRSIDTVKNRGIAGRASAFTCLSG